MALTQTFSGSLIERPSEAVRAPGRPRRSTSDHRSGNARMFIDALTSVAVLLAAACSSSTSGDSIAGEVSAEHAGSARVEASSTVDIGCRESADCRTANSRHGFVDDLPLGGLFLGNYATGLHTGNSRIAHESSRRFRADRSGAVVAVKYANRVLDDATIAARCESQGPGSRWCDCIDQGLDAYSCGYTLGNSYSVGNGGEIVIELRADDAGMPGDTALGRTRGVFVPQQHADDYFPRLSFEEPVSLRAGQIYHLVYRNLAPPARCALSGVPLDEAPDCDRDRGAIGLNGVLLGRQIGRARLGVDPFRGHSAANLVRGAGSEDWHIDGDNLSWYELEYADGIWVGDSYGAYHVGRDATHVLGGRHMARQIFEIIGADKSVDGLWVNFGQLERRRSGLSPVTARILDDSGRVVATTAIGRNDGCSVPSEDARDLSRFGLVRCTYWAHATLETAVTLERGRTYRLELSTPADEPFVLSAYYANTHHGARSRNHWTAARAEISEDGGATWSSWSDKFPDRDLPVLLTIVGKPKALP